MPDPPTQKDVQRDLDRAQQHLEDDQEGEGATATSGSLSLQFRRADPETRPKGMAWDPDEGVLAYDLWSAQRETLDALEDKSSDVVAFLAGYGSGKSITGARWLIAQALAYPGSRFLALGIDFTKARDATFRILFENLPGGRTDVVTSSYNGPETSPIVADYNRSEHRLTLINDTVIKLGSADKWNRYAGDEYGAIWMDEPSHYGEDLHDLLEMMGSRLRGVEGPKVMFWTLTGNGYNAAWEIIEKRRDSDGEPIGLDIDVIRASTLENPYLDPADKDRFERQYGGTGREEQALHGGFAAAQGLVYSAFSRDTHVIPQSEARNRTTDDWRIYGYDAGWNDPRVVLEVGKTASDQLVVLDEFHESESHVEDAIGWIDNKSAGRIYSEHEPAEIETMERAGLTVEKAEKSLDAGISEVRNRLEVDSEDRPGILVSDQCRNLIREFLGYKQEQVGKSQAVDHCLDCLRYLCMGDQSDDGGSGGFMITRHY